MVCSVDKHIHRKKALFGTLCFRSSRAAAAPITDAMIDRQHWSLVGGWNSSCTVDGRRRVYPYADRREGNLKAFFRLENRTPCLPSSVSPFAPLKGSPMITTHSSDRIQLLSSPYRGSLRCPISILWKPSRACTQNVIKQLDAGGGREPASFIDSLSVNEMVERGMDVRNSDNANSQRNERTGPLKLELAVLHSVNPLCNDEKLYALLSRQAPLLCRPTPITALCMFLRRRAIVLVALAVPRRITSAIDRRYPYWQ